MTTNPKTVPPPPARRQSATATRNPQQTADLRWQRTVRFNWDKRGSSKGGRK